MTKKYKEGIYFNMPEEEYHNLAYFSRSGCETMIFDNSGEEYWYKSDMNPHKEEKESTPAMELGTALHTMILEPNKFKSTYIAKPTFDDYDTYTILSTIDDLKDELRWYDLPVNGTKPKLIERLDGYINDDKTIIWDNVIKEFNNKVEANNLKVLNENQSEILNGIKESLERRPNISSYFKNIVSEVTIIWRDELTGVMCKCRLDGVTIDSILELKSFSTQGKTLTKTIYDTINFSKYNLQFYVYYTALCNIIKKVNAGAAEIYGEVDKNWLNEFLEEPSKKFNIIYCRTQAPYQIRALNLEVAEIEGAEPNEYFKQANDIWNTGIMLYANCVRKYGTNRWGSDDFAETLTDERVPAILYQIIE
jgi:hypothetical protein